jgi:tetratricopeptide (TPR) repeat protein
MKRILAVALVLLSSAMPSTLCAQAGRRAAAMPPNARGGNQLGAEPFDTLLSPPAQDLAPNPQRGEGLVPVSQLRIPSKAMKEFTLAQKAYHSGDISGSTEHLQKALRIYPDFIEAHNALGLRFIQLGEYQQAIAEHELALSLAPQLPEAHQDLSFALLVSNRLPEAEAEARQALHLDDQRVPARYVLGRAIIAQGRITPESVEMLRASENLFPDASLVLAQIHFVAGKPDQVVTELRHYLKAPSDPDNKQKAECWLAQLTKQALPAGCPAEPRQPSFR